ncbi:MAG: hypothetical protein UR80_C0019G0007 [Parcubacteria group bacterium GW2011_GWB1_35_5]|uniref:Uncharacterized protein n=1 Tax=Candidatus Zambryskibacteria bacterium RIFCSPLOWO2_01_FULL_35_19 TaxID=1802757 RepID=A0A1G2TY41_9BACT|nr:MAG: hypothetical protein UR50_C0001G0043 [Parcubacteria group bacterium GW2011_GWC1_34_10]KKP80775.1 MAG: hypothetical protein UR80_C0019G0007 [Parcubacteria group bacterium GW2011_GWB1_35_5]OHB02154.1 MAG: hypothetical protein A3A90_02125 [Candidatus Zambryskibacteria bacterium RIFCSPLOWO2_01_FULL_35_19]
MQKNIQERPLYFYVANLGSEIQRVLVWKEKGDKESMQTAFKRVISIIDKIKSFNNKSANTEMDILQKYLEELVLGNEKTVLNRSQISSFFNPFALRVVSSL